MLLRLQRSAGNSGGTGRRVQMKPTHRRRARGGRQRPSHVPKANVVADANGVKAVPHADDGAAPGYGPGGAQWQHVTSYVSFEVLVEDVLRGVQWGNIAGALSDLIDNSSRCR